ncbi:hypothetical protein [Roseicella aquatilis]|uniref:Uncharacterized protein n=1 Tax=Roseicella aquatilis TaxID=2527868 RepID=A0A4R4D2W0_9PROT|nr:hypothetical protein [Roseicella aquatilis]TCZ53365.1 hypothetical protein EXY23_24895 [Roseicella aquatilis]
MQIRDAALAGCLILLAAPALAQPANTATSPSVTPAPAAVPDAAPPAQRPREGGALIPIPTWRDTDGKLVSVDGNKLSEPERMNAGKPYTPLPWGSVVANVPGMNAGPSVRPLPPGSVPATQDRMMAGRPWSPIPQGVAGAHPNDSPAMQAGPAPRPLPVGSRPADIVAGGGVPPMPIGGGAVPVTRPGG